MSNLLFTKNKYNKYEMYSVSPGLEGMVDLKSGVSRIGKPLREEEAHWLTSFPLHY